MVSSEKKYDIIELLEDLMDENKACGMQEYFKIQDVRNQKEMVIYFYFSISLLYQKSLENIQLWQMQNIICYFLDGGCLNEYAELCEYSR